MKHFYLVGNFCRDVISKSFLYVLVLSHVTEEFVCVEHLFVHTANCGTGC